MSVVRASAMLHSARAMLHRFAEAVAALLLKTDPLGPAYYVAALCGLGFCVGLYLLTSKR